jgi:CBS domain containing-hemolysin-like protein
MVLALLLSTSVLAVGVVETPAQQPADPDAALIMLIIFVALALVVSFLCSIAETVLLSITPAYIESLRSVDAKAARHLQVLRQEKVDRPLAAILTMNTIAHTVGAIEAGAQSAILFGSAWVGVFSAVMTLMILFFSEIIPKTLGALYWPRLVRVTVAYIRALILGLYPLVLASEWLTKLITRDKKMHCFSREEFVAMADLGEQVGEIDPRESQIIQNLFRFRSLKATDIMTPRTVVSALPETMSISQAQEAVQHIRFSRLPVYRDDIDSVTGFVLRYDVLLQTEGEDQEATLQLCRRELRVVPELMELPALLDVLLAQRQHIALVADEYGGTKGLVTLEDVIETLLGTEIVDEMDSVSDMRALARRQWEKRARALGIDLSQEEKA